MGRSASYLMIWDESGHLLTLIRGYNDDGHCMNLQGYHAIISA